MALTLTVTDHWEDGRRVHVVGNLLASGNYSTGGDAVTLSSPLIKSGASPVFIIAQAAGYNCVGLPGAAGSTPPAAKLQFYTDTTGLEVAAGAYPVGLTTTLIQVYAIFIKGR